VGTYLHPALLALAIITVGRFQAVILVDSIAILIKGLVLVYKRKQVSNILWVFGPQNFTIM
jgi:hypothetical protein